MAQAAQPLGRAAAIAAMPQLALAVVLGRGSEGPPLCRVAVDADGDVMDLKDEIEREAGVPSAEQRLYTGGRLMRDVDDLIAFSLDGEEALVELVRLDRQKAETLRRLENGEMSLGELDEASREDRDFVLAALWRAGAMTSDVRRAEAIAQVGEALWADREVVLAAVTCDGGALGRAAAPIHGDRAVVLAAVAQDGQALTHASDALRRDREVVLTAVRRNGFVLELLPEELRGDRQVVLTALHRTGAALQFVAEPLRQDWDVIATAVRTDPDAIDHAPGDLRGDHDFQRFMKDYFVKDRRYSPEAQAEEGLRMEGMWG
uniref:Ubiquitin-like domain-containing protein n=1 Tax=Alexandrium monilatum TaxID=311494 RepID=A0A7S4RRX5_9DINO